MSAYTDRLDALWASHLAPRQPYAPTVISTFAGCGGSSLGYSAAGFRELLAVEWDDNAVETFALNFPDVPVYHGDIALLSVDEVLFRTGLRPGELSVFDGSPPCQGFSSAGKRLLDDPRNQLFRHYVRLLDGLRPQVFVMENVAGMVKGKMKLVFAEILRELKACGYRVSVRLLNAMYFGVPQARQRMIFIGVRDDLPMEPSHPSAGDRVVSAREAWEGVQTDQEEREWLLAAGQKYALYKAWDYLPYGANTRFGDHYRINPDKPLRTVTKMAGNVTIANVMHPWEKRRPSTAELKRASSYPDQFRFVGGFEMAAARIGNSVPPLLMHAVASHIRDEILVAPLAQAAD